MFKRKLHLYMNNRLDSLFHFSTCLSKCYRNVNQICANSDVNYLNSETLMQS